MVKYDEIVTWPDLLLPCDGRYGGMSSGQGGRGGLGCQGGQVVGSVGLVRVVRVLKPLYINHLGLRSFFALALT